MQQGPKEPPITAHPLFQQPAVQCDTAVLEPTSPIEHHEEEVQEDVASPVIDNDISQPIFPGSIFSGGKAGTFVGEFELLYKSGDWRNYKPYKEDGGGVSGFHRLRGEVEQCETISEEELRRKIIKICKNHRGSKNKKKFQCHFFTDCNEKGGVIPLHLVQYSDMLEKKFNGPYAAGKDTLDVDGWHTFILLGIAASYAVEVYIGEKKRFIVPRSHFLGRCSLKQFLYGQLLPEFWQYLYEAYYLEITIDKVFDAFAQTYVYSFDPQFQTDWFGVEIGAFGGVPEKFPYLDDFLPRVKRHFEQAIQSSEDPAVFIQPYRSICNLHNVEPNEKLALQKKDEFEQKLREIMSRRVYNIRKQRYDDLCAVLNMEPQKILYYRDHESGDGYIYLNYYPEKKE